MDNAAWRRVIYRTMTLAGWICVGILTWWLVARLLFVMGVLPAPAAIF